MKAYVVVEVYKGCADVMGVCSSLKDARHIVFSTMENLFGEKILSIEKKMDVISCCYEEYHINDMVYSITLRIIDNNID